MQRQLRLGDILDDYCPRERRVTNHAVVAMIGDDVKQTRCATCETEHEYKKAKVPRQRRKTETPAALYAQVAANGPKRVTHEAPVSNGSTAPREAVVDETSDRREDERENEREDELAASATDVQAHDAGEPEADEVAADADADGDGDRDDEREEEEGPVHRPLIRASLPRHEGQAPPTRPIPEFTIRQPAGRQNRFRPRFQRPGGGSGGGQQFQGNRPGGSGNGNMGGGPPRGGMRQGGGGRPPQGGMSSRPARRNGPGRKPSK